MKQQLTHFGPQGRAKMVDVGHKARTERVAVATGRISMQPATLEKIQAGKMAKGDVFAVAQVAGVMAAKRTPDLVPMCHPILLTSLDLVFEEQSIPDSDGLCHVIITATAKTTGQTGVEMEALTAVCIAALTLYDMCKAVDREMTIDHIGLVLKVGGKSGMYVRKRKT